MSDAVRLVDAARLTHGRRCAAASIRAGRTETVEQFRAGQVVWGVLALAAGLALALLLAATRGGGAGAARRCSSGLSALTGVLVRDWAADRASSGARESRMLAELPTIAELLALAVGAGEGPIGALERVVRDARTAS